MPTRECYHCKQLIEVGEPHDCWTTTEAALTQDLSEDLQEAWERLRETAAELGEQRIYASHSSIMFSRKSCYFFVRPKKSFLEVCIFLGRAVKAPQIRRVDRTSKTKLAHLIQVRHRDEVEAPLTDWLQEAYRFPESAQDCPGASRARKSAKRQAQKSGQDRQERRRGPRSEARSGARRHWIALALADPAIEGRAARLCLATHDAAAPATPAARALAVVDPEPRRSISRAGRPARSPPPAPV